MFVAEMRNVQSQSRDCARSRLPGQGIQQRMVLFFVNPSYILPSDWKRGIIAPALTV
jgi:hypothetical protein